VGSIIYEIILFVGLDLYVCLLLKWDCVLDFLKIASMRPAGMRVSQIVGSSVATCSRWVASAGADLPRGYGYEKCISARISPVLSIV